MKIETLRDPIPPYDPSIRDKLKSRKAEIAEAVTRNKEREKRRDKQERSDEHQHSFAGEEQPSPDQESAFRSLDVVV